MNSESISRYIELLNLDPLSTVSMIEDACSLAAKYQVAAICVPPVFVKKAREFLKDSPVKLSTVAGYPIGFNAVESKLADIILAILDGADEINLTINITALKNNDWQYLASELNAILPVLRSKNKEIIVDIHAEKLSKDDLTKCCDLYGIAGVNMLQLSSAILSIEDQLENIKYIRSVMAEAIGIKINTEIHSQDNVKTLIGMGVTRIGTIDLNYLAIS